MQDDFTSIIKECTYKGERYSVRNNGEVMRHRREGRRPRRSDNKWTFGTPNDRTGYLEIASVRVHRIVATAFLGEPPTTEHVVDHIDTNKRNNRPENLRWVTKLENILLNPITAKRIALVCGSVEAFLADPAKFHDKFQEPNYSWMCNVSAQEARESYSRLLAWAQSDKAPSGGTLGEWLFSRTTERQSRPADTENVPVDTFQSLTANAGQRNWSVPMEFPCCPREYLGKPLATYAAQLKIGSVLCRNEFYASLVIKTALSIDGQSLYVLTRSTKRNSVKPWAFTRVTYENGLFVHSNLGSFFEELGAEKQLYLAQGLEWTGGDSLDDFV